MKIRAIRDGVVLKFPSGDQMKVGLEWMDVPKEFERDVRRDTPHVFGVEIQSEKKKQGTEEKGGA